MGIFKDTLLVSDVDGTLITYGGTIPESNVEAIRRFIDGGGLFTIATGRGVQSARRYINKIQHNCAPIIYNGGAIYEYETERFLWQKTLPVSAKVLVKEILERFPLMGVQVYCGLELFILNSSDVCERMTTHEKIEFTETSIDKIWDREWNKVLCLAQEPLVLEMIAELEKVKTDGYYFCRTQVEYYEIMAVGADKGNALKRLAEIKGIDMKDTCAVGDYYNDEALIDAAGYSAYAENAPEELKAKADYIAAHCEQGAVADFVDHLEKRKSL